MRENQWGAKFNGNKVVSDLRSCTSTKIGFRANCGRSPLSSLFWSCIQQQQCLFNDDCLVWGPCQYWNDAGINSVMRCNPQKLALCAIFFRPLVYYDALSNLDYFNIKSQISRKSLSHTKRLSIVLLKNSPLKYNWIQLW